MLRGALGMHKAEPLTQLPASVSPAQPRPAGAEPPEAQPQEGLFLVQAHREVSWVRWGCRIQPSISQCPQPLLLDSSGGVCSPRQPFVLQTIPPPRSEPSQDTAPSPQPLPCMPQCGDFLISPSPFSFFSLIVAKKPQTSPGRGRELHRRKRSLRRWWHAQPWGHRVTLLPLGTVTPPSPGEAAAASDACAMVQRQKWNGASVGRASPGGS